MTDQEQQLFVMQVTEMSARDIQALLRVSEALYPEAKEILEAEAAERKRKKQPKRHRLEQFLKQAGIESRRQELRSVPVVGYREWIHFQYPNAMLKVYLRASRRLLEGVMQQTFEIATVDAEPAGTGAFSHFLESVEQLCMDYHLTVYVENVLSNRFAAFLEKKGYIRHNIPGQGWTRSMFKRFV